MAVTLRAENTPPETASPGVERRSVLTSARVPGTKVLLEEIDLSARASITFEVSRGDLGWIHVVRGEAVLAHGSSRLELGRTHIVLLPSETPVTLTASSPAFLLHVRIPQAVRFDTDLQAQPQELRVVDWSREPVLDSKHDARKRIYIATPKLFGTRAVKGEMIIYPPGTEASNHHHEGAEHFMYVLNGKGTAFANEQPVPVRAGDVIYYDEGERHYLRSEGDEEMIFVEFFVPGVYKTIWAEGAAICTWTPTGRDIQGKRPVRDIEGHSSALPTPQDV